MASTCARPTPRALPSDGVHHVHGGLAEAPLDEQDGDAAQQQRQADRHGLESRARSSLGGQADQHGRQGGHHEVERQAARFR